MNYSLWLLIARLLNAAMVMSDIPSLSERVSFLMTISLSVIYIYCACSCDHSYYPPLHRHDVICPPCSRPAKRDSNKETVFLDTRRMRFIWCRRVFPVPSSVVSRRVYAGNSCHQGRTSVRTWVLSRSAPAWTMGYTASWRYPWPR